MDGGRYKIYAPVRRGLRVDVGAEGGSWGAQVRRSSVLAADDDRRLMPADDQVVGPRLGGTSPPSSSHSPRLCTGVRGCEQKHNRTPPHNGGAALALDILGEDICCVAGHHAQALAPRARRRQ